MRCLTAVLLALAVVLAGLGAAGARTGTQRPYASPPTRPVFPKAFNTTGWLVASGADCPGPTEMTGFSLSTSADIDAVRFAWLKDGCTRQPREHEWMARYENATTYDISYASKVCFTGRTKFASAAAFWVAPLSQASFTGRQTVAMLHQYCNEWTFTKGLSQWKYCANDHGHIISMTVPQPWIDGFELQFIFEPLQVGDQPASTFHIPAYC
jgi:hypothetical protein